MDANVAFHHLIATTNSSSKKRKLHSGKGADSTSNGIILDEFVDTSAEVVNTEYITSHNIELATVIDRENNNSSPANNSADEGSPKPIAMRSKQKMVENPLRLSGTHVPAFCKYVCQHPEDPTKTISFDKRKTCPVCHQRSNIYCLRCNIGLHIRTYQERGCWEIFHSEDFH